MATDKHPADITTQLHRWAIEEMHFHPQGRNVNTKLPTQDDFKEICRGKMVDIWKFVIGQAHSVQKVKQVQGNLALKRRNTKSYKVRYKSGESYKSEKAELLKRRAQLSGEITSVLTDISHVENDLDRIGKEILETETDYEKHKYDIDDIRRRTTLCQMFSQQCMDTVKEYEEFTNRINRKVDHVIQRSKKSTESEEYYSRKKSSTEDDHYSDQSGLETKCARNIRETCQYVGSFLNQVLQGSFGTDKTEFQRKRDVLWTEVEKVLSEFSVLQICGALITNTQDTTINLHEMTTKIDIRKDAENLRFKYEKSGHFTDVSSPPTLLKSVHQLLQENQVQQIQRFIETEKHNNEAWKLEQQLKEVKGQIDEKIQKQFKKQNDLKVVRLYTDTEMELAGKKVVMHYINEESNRLREKIAKCLREKEILVTKYQKIQDFKDLADKKQNLIRVLVKQNASARSRLDAQQEEIQSYIQRSLLSHETEAKSLSTDLHGCVVTEIDKFTGLVLPYLLFTLDTDSSLKVAIADLSINQSTHPVSIATKQQLQKVLDTIRFSVFQAPELILPHCFKIKSDIEELLELNDSKTRGDNQSAIKKDVVKFVSELYDMAVENDRKLIERSLPVIQQRINRTGQALSDCIRVKDEINEWWDQPAQYTVPWVISDQHNLQQWKDKWTVQVTKLRQMMVQK